MGVTPDDDLDGGGSGSPGTPVFVSTYRILNRKTDLTLSPTGVDILNLSGKGRLESIFVDVEDKNTQIEVYIDGTKQFTIDIEVFDVAGVNDKPLIGPMNVVAGGKNFQWYPRFPVYYSTSLVIKGVQAGSKRLHACMITYTEE